jgi:hypothetical protein
MDAGMSSVCIYDSRGTDRKVLENVICAHPATVDAPAGCTVEVIA